jgi:hypothetical protein
MAHLFTYFVCLSKEDHTVINSTGVELQLSRFHGPDDWSRSVTDQSAMNNILKSPQAYGGPFTLTPPAITDLLAAVVIQSTKLDLHQIALSVSWPSITKSVLKQLCPNLDRPTLTISNEMGRQQVIIVGARFKYNQDGMTHYPSNGPFPANICPISRQYTRWSSIPLLHPPSHLIEVSLATPLLLRQTEHQ